MRHHHALDRDPAPDFQEIGRRQIEQIDGPHRGAEQEGEKRYTPSQKPPARRATHDFIKGAEVNGGVEIDGATEILCGVQSGWQIGYFDKTVVDGQVPEAFEDADQLEAI